MELNYKAQESLFNKIAISIVVFLFVIIIILSLYVFNISSPIDKSTQEISQNKPIKYGQGVTIISSSEPQKFINSYQTWLVKDISQSKIKIQSSLKLSVNMSVAFDKDAPSSSSAGIIYSNGLGENDPNVRRISVYYYLKKEEWILKYQSGKTVEFHGILSIPKEKAQSNFSLIIASNGKNVLVTLPNKSTRLINLPNSMYDISNQMTIHALVGPKSNMQISSLNYEIPL